MLSLVTSSYATRIYGGQYTAERITNLRDNCNRYEWGRKLRDDAVQRAKSWLLIDDQKLWGMVPGQDLPRTIDVTLDRLGPKAKVYGCLVCGSKIFHYGNYPYEPDIVNKPWKLTCPSCGSVFPTNDFGKYYESGIDEKGLFNPTTANKKLLYNTAHPDPKDPLHLFGVDDGYGYINQEGHRYKFIGYYTYKYWRYLFSGLNALADAYLYTGDQRYAHKAAIILDRIADVYPDMDWKPYADQGWYHSDGGSKLGKIEGSIWETGMIQQLADDYDKILSGTENDQALYAFLNGQSKKYKLPAKKGTRDLFVENVDNGILRTAYKAVLSKQIRGNQGMHQLTMAMCAVALNTNPESSQWLDWIFSPDGGNIPELMINKFDHDGSSDEGAPGYTFLWGHLITKLAEVLQKYPSYTKHNIFRDFPQFSSAFTLAYHMAIFGEATPNIGDSGATGLVDNKSIDPQFMALGYAYSHDPEIAIAAYRSNGNSAKGLGRNIYSSNPDSLSREIERIAKNAGPRHDNGYLMSSFGLALLETGKGSSAVGIACNYGRTIHHAHPDMLNFDMFSNHHWLAPDHGYPEFATDWPSNTEWTGSTLSHNTVFVNRHPQKEIWGGHTKLFKQLKGFGVFEINGKEAYPGLQDYSRTMFLVGGSGGVDSNAYIIDVFHIAGGNDHVYSFHGPSGDVESTGLNLQVQQTGTYAGKNVPKGALAKDFPIGYSYLYNVKKDLNPPSQFMIDWKVSEDYRGLTAKDNVHLRMHSLTQSNDLTLADGDPPQNKEGNPHTLGYVLMHKAGNDLNSTFVSVIEPYKVKPFIKSVKRVDDGKGEAIAIEVEMVNGNTDYVLYNPSTQKTMRLPNHISMSGTVGYLHTKGNKVYKGILINGTALEHDNLKMKSSGAITGKIIKMNKGLTGGGWILVNSKLPTDGSLKGQEIIISTETERDASYRISDVVMDHNLSKIICGPTSFIRGSINPVKNGSSSGTAYLYDFEEGAGFTIPSHSVWNTKLK